MRSKTKGLRAHVARTLADLDPTRRGSRGKRVTSRAANELTSAAEEIRKRFLGGGDSTRSAAGRKAAATRKRNTAKRSAAAKKGAQTRAKSGR